MVASNKTLEDHYNFFFTSCWDHLDPIKDAQQITDIKRCFYAGALQMFYLITSTSILSEENAIEQLSQLHKELESFSKDL